MKLLLISIGKAGIPATVLHEFSPTKRTCFVVGGLGLTGSFSVWGGIFQKAVLSQLFHILFSGK